MTTLQLEYEYEVENIFEYLIESYYCGQKKQVREIAGQLDRTELVNYLIENNETQILKLI